jgi:putative heme iron utilization protein
LAHEVEEKVSEVLRDIPEDALEAIYGDHVEVIVDRDGAKTEGYEHD